MNILGLIPARAGSKRVPFKNIKTFGGQPLIKYSIEEALRSKYIDRVVVSTESDLIANISRKFGADVPTLRPEKLAEDSAKSLPVLMHMVEYLETSGGYSPDLIVLLQPTSPLRKAEHIDAAIEMMLGDIDADSLVSLVKVDHTMHPLSVMKKRQGDEYTWFLPSNEGQDRSLTEAAFSRNGAIYIARRKALNSFEHVFGGKTLGYVMEKEVSVDIDTIFDFDVAEYLYSRQGKKEGEDDRGN